MMQRSRPAAFAMLIETTDFGSIQLADNVHEVRLVTRHRSHDYHMIVRCGSDSVL
jgi:hypothetical protein